MQPIQFFAARHDDGALLPNATIDVYLKGTQTRATLYADDSETPLANPAYADAGARVFLYTTAERVDIQISKGGYVAPLMRDILVVDVTDTLAEVQDLADQVVESVADAAASAEAAAAGGEVYASTADALSNGVYSLDSLVVGSGGTDGTFALSFSGGAGSGAAGWFTVVSGAISAYEITARGRGYTSAPTVSFAASAGLSGASATAVISANRSVGQYFYVPSATDAGFMTQYEVTTGPVATATGKILPSVQAIGEAENRGRANLDQVKKGQGQRDAVAGYVYSIRDVLNKIALALTEQGETYLAGIVTDLNSPSRDVSLIPFAIKDNAGKSAIGVDEAGRAVITEIVQKIKSTSNSREAQLFLWALQGADGKVPLGINDRGEVVATDIYQSVGEGSGLREYRKFVWWLKGADGKAVIGIDAEGKVHLKLAPESLEDLSGLTYTVPSDFGVDYQVFNVRGFDSWDVATRQDKWGQVFDIKKLHASASNAAVAEGVGPILFSPVIGQSNAGQGGSTGVIYDDTAYPHHCMQFSSGTSAYGTDALNPALLVDFKPTSDVGHEGQFASVLAAFALENLTRETELEPTSGIVNFSSWYGGQPISTFVRGTTSWDNLMTAASRSKVVAAKYGRDIDCRFVTFIQGESSSAGYKAALLSLSDDMVGELQLQMGLVTEPMFLLLQINNSDDATGSSDVHQAQLEVAYENVNGNVILAGPMYDAPMAADGIHQTPIGRMIVGDKLAVAQRAILDGEAFEPLWPLSVVRAGVNVDITYNKPVAFDADWMLPAVENQGFLYADDSTSAAISSVSILSTFVIRITLDQVPVGANPVIKYAINSESDVDGWASGRGQVYSPTTIKSFYYQRGYTVPEFVRHYSVRFTEEIL